MGKFVKTETCSRGHKWTPENTYTTKNGHRTCRKCRTLSARKWNETHRDAQCRHSVRSGLKQTAKKRGASPEVVTRLRGAVCEVCGAPPPNYVDHNHKTNALRGTLCRGCNMGIGCFKDSLYLLQRAIDYLRRYENA